MTLVADEYALRYPPKKAVVRASEIHRVQTLASVCHHKRTPFVIDGGYMPEKSSSQSFAGELKTSIGDTAKSVKEKGSELSQKAGEAINESRPSVASSLDSAAGKLRDHAADLPGGDKTANLAKDAADKLESSAEYVRTHGTEAMLKDAKSFVKSHPALSVAGAVFAGLLVGWMFRSKD
jgi:ElaB/YqjD/DUF883 family membrane-anchored ribosome-binding protein